MTSEALRWSKLAAGHAEAAAEGESMSRGIGLYTLLTLALVLATRSAAFAQSFIDDFASDSTGSYTLTLILPEEGTGTFVYDAAGQRAQILTGDDFGLRVAHEVPSRTSGRFTIDLLPTQKWPNGGQTFLRLRQDAANYYEISNFDGYAPGTLRKIVGGLVVATASFTAGYVQNVAYHVRFDFTPELSELSAFGQTLAIDQDVSPLAITSVEIEMYQQSAYVDDISYDDIVNFAPLADAGPDQAVADGDLVQLDGSASSDVDGSIATYSWQQLSGPAVALSDASSASPTFVAPDPGSGSVDLVFELTVTDDAGAPASDAVQIEAWSSEALSFRDDFSSNTTGDYTRTLIAPAKGTGTFVYDGVGQRAQILTGNDFGLRVAHDLPPRTSGRLSVDLLPTKKWPIGGQIYLRLRQDSANYYEISNFDGYAPGTLRKIVGGLVVATASFTAGYVQNAAYHVLFDFAPDLAELTAFGQSLAIAGDSTPLTIRSLEIETYQQNVYLDNVSYGEAVNLVPLADAGPDQAVVDGDLVQLDGSASSDIHGTIATYSWQQLSGPSVALSDASSPSPTFVAPDPGSGSVDLVFELTVTDDVGAPASDEVQIEAWSSESLHFSDDFSSDTTGGYTLTLILPEEGTGTLVYDGVGQRAQILTGNDFGLRVAHDLPPRSRGRFSVDLLPTLKHPGTAILSVRLVQDANNYFELTNTTPATPGTLTKVVGGVAVDTVSFTGGYSQNTPYTITIDFSPNLTVAAAFGQDFALVQDATPLTITRFEIESYQQNVYFDNVSYSQFAAAVVPALPGAGIGLLAVALLGSAVRVTRRRAGRVPLERRA
jgi:hypothetical protein